MSLNRLNLHLEVVDCYDVGCSKSTTTALQKGLLRAAIVLLPKYLGLLMFEYSFGEMLKHLSNTRISLRELIADRLYFLKCS